MAIGNFQTENLFFKFCQKYICFVILFVLNLKFSHLNADLRSKYPCMTVKTHSVKTKEKKEKKNYVKKRWITEFVPF